MTTQANTVSTTGLRYTTKKNGTPYAGNYVGKTMSCTNCGSHAPRSEGVFGSLMGRAVFFCSETCKGKLLPQKKHSPKTEADK